MLHFESPWAFLILLAVPALHLWRVRRRRGSLRFSSTDHAKRAGRSLRQRFMFLPQALRVLALVLLAVGLARPQLGKERIRDVSKGVAIEMVVDRSGSMGQVMEFEGERTNRLEVVKRVFEEFVFGNKKGLKGRPNDLVGMVAFARYADTVCPLTLAHGALSRLMEAVKLPVLQTPDGRTVPDRSEDGTAIGDAVALAAARLEKAEETLARQTQEKGREYTIKSKAVILLTDGQQNAGKRDVPLHHAEMVHEGGVIDLVRERAARGQGERENHEQGREHPRGGAVLHASLLPDGE